MWILITNFLNQGKNWYFIISKAYISISMKIYALCSRYMHILILFSKFNFKYNIVLIYIFEEKDKMKRKEKKGKMG